MTKQLNEGFKRSVNYTNTNNDDNKVERDSHRKCFLPRVDITKYNAFIDGQLMIKSRSTMKLEKLQQEKEMITQQDVC